MHHSVRMIVLGFLLGAVSTAFPRAGTAAEPGAEAAEAGDASNTRAPEPSALDGSLFERFEALTDNDLVLEDTFSVEGVELSDRFMRWKLETGLVTPIRTKSGRTIGGWFQGECSFSYTPPLGQETFALELGSGRRSLDEIACTEAYFVTNDSLLLETVSRGAEVVPEPPTAPSKLVRGARKANTIQSLDGHHHADFAMSALRSELKAVPTGAREITFLELSLRTEEFGRPKNAPRAEPMNTLYYQRDPLGKLSAQEPVYLSGAREGSYHRPLASHPWEGEPETTFLVPNVDLVSADLDLDIKAGPTALFAEMKAVATITLTTRNRPVDTVALSLLDSKSFKREFQITKPLGFEVESVTDFKGRPVDFLHQDGTLLVRLHSSLPPGQGEVLTITYTGNAMPRIGADSFGLLANYPWWPQGPKYDRFLFSASLCIPASFRAAGTGSTVKTWRDGGKRCERWEEPVPVGFVAINMGRWVTEEINGPRGIKLRAFFLPEDDNQMEGALQQTKRALAFFEGLYGPYPYEELDIAQARDNMFFWQAPAGLLELSKTSIQVQKTAKKDLQSDFYPEPSIATLAHEVAHQWWGHVVGWKTYRDQWISESFAEYSSFLYMNQYYGQESYLGRLEYWEQGARKSDRRGPATLGFRLGRAGSTGQMYRRGPYILHMLRRQVGDRPFMDFLAAIPSVAANRNIATGDLLEIARSVLGEEVDAFFDQWLLKTGLPKLEAVWKVEGDVLVVTLK
ncbi:MAG: M1 family aminopeptidase, partial [Myxococcota bacterium]|nr:M1 family aminopeptidase [Myxococcota bacterium]